MFGAKDWDVTWVGADERRHQTMKIAGSDLVVVPDALHFFDDKEDELTRVIGTFLDRVFHSGRPAAGRSLSSGEASQQVCNEAESGIEFPSFA